MLPLIVRADQNNAFWKMSIRLESMSPKVISPFSEALVSSARTFPKRVPECCCVPDLTSTTTTRTRARGPSTSTTTTSDPWWPTNGPKMAPSWWRKLPLSNCDDVTRLYHDLLISLNLLTTDKPFKPNPNGSLLHLLLTTRFLPPGLSTVHFCAD